MRSIALLSLHADPSTRVGSLQNGGVTIYVRELARAFVANGDGVDVYTRRTSPEQAAEELVDGYRLIRVDAGPATDLDNDAIAAHLEEAYQFLRPRFAQRAYDLVSSHYWLSGFVGKRLARDFRISHAHTLHSHGTARKTRDDVTRARIDIERDLLRTERIVTLSVEHRKAFLDEYGLMPPNLAVIPGGIDLQRFSPGSRVVARERLGLNPGSSYVGYVGRLAQAKGIDELIAAFALLRAMGSQSRLFVVGGAKRNSRIDALRAFAARFGVERAIDFVGPIPNDLVADAFRAADVIAVPSHYEAFGLVALEARACGVPVVASDVGGLRELVNAGNGGVRVPPSNPVAWAHELSVALAEPERSLRTMRARSSDLSGYAWTTIAERIASFACGDVTAA